jgi:3'-phosphoadenosine 5'-phosphosulfate sulfotransferase (PAPS reductase)/FAD synthetase
LDNFSRFEAASASDIVSWAIDTFGSSFAIATSFQKEGMVILDLASRISAEVRVFTLDTGRLPDETYRMMETVRQRYGIPVEIIFPDRDDVEDLVALHGPNLFYSSVPARQRCCGVRKVRPLERKLETLKAWATGLRRDQSESRAGFQGRPRRRPHQDLSPRRLESRSGRCLHRPARRPRAPLVRPRLHQHRLRALHSGRSARRE